MIFHSCPTKRSQSFKLISSTSFNLFKSPIFFQKHKINHAIFILHEKNFNKFEFFKDRDNDQKNIVFQFLNDNNK